MAKSPNPNTKSTNRTPIRSSKKAPRARLLERSASKRGSLEDDYAESHLIVSGEFNGFKCIKGDGNKVVLVKNKRNRMVKQKTEVEVPDGYLRELDHFDTMLDITDIEGGGDDEELIKYEQTSWTCPKCKMANLNDSSYCSNFIQGKQCMGNPAVVLKTWDGCFAAKDKTWKCDTCTSENPIDRGTCACCETAKSGSGSADVSVSVAAVKMPGSIISSHGFSFCASDQSHAV